MKNLITIGLLFFAGLANAQTGGTIKGVVYAAADSTAIPFAMVKITVAGETIGVKADINGKFKLNGVKPGSCIVASESPLHGKKTLNDVSVVTDQIVLVDMYLTKNLKIVEVKYRPKKININNGMTINKLDLKYSMYTRDPKAMLAKQSSEIKLSSNNKLIIRGSRPGDVIYYIDGVKQTGMQSLPGVAIGGMQVFTGGVPAKYGDTTGGVVILQTKSYFDLYYAWKAKQ